MLVATGVVEVATYNLRQREWSSQEKREPKEQPQAQGPGHLQPSNTVRKSHMLTGDEQLSRIPQNAAAAESLA